MKANIENKLKYWIKDEFTASRDYLEMWKMTGDDRFYEMAMDESKHKGYLEAMLKEMK